MPGLGTDSRIFHQLRLPIPVYYLNWIKPNQNESLKSYAKRIAEQIDFDFPIILGVSFGGIIVQEIAHQMPVQAVILVSTITSPSELPFNLRMMRKLPLYHLAQGSWRIKTLALWAPRFGIQTESEQALLKSIFSRFGDTERMWAIRQLVHWEGIRESLDQPSLRLHGTEDHVFPFSHIQTAKAIQGGRHFMIYQQAEEMSREIMDFLSGSVHTPESYS